MHQWLELMGVSDTSKAKSGLARINVVSTALMGEMELAGKKIKTEVVPVGAFKIPNTMVMMFSMQ